MAYRRASGKNVPANTFENMILWNNYARLLLNEYFKDIEVWSLDESSIVSADPRTRGWFFPWETGNYTQRQIIKRVSLLVAVSSRGRIIYSMYSKNVSSLEFILFFEKMLQLLKED